MTVAFELISGRLCLDFVNTVSERPRSRATREDLPDYEALLAWAQYVGALTPRGARVLRRLARGQPAEARRAHREALALRERLHRLIRAVIDRRPPHGGDLERFGAQLGRVLARRQIRYRDGRYEQAWADGTSELTSLLWPVLLSAQQVLCADDPARLGACQTPEGCGWIYYDTSKNRSRRWCSMQTCGNASKARRLQARRKRATS